MKQTKKRSTRNRSRSRHRNNLTPS